jgi:hypothetical protein
MGHRLPTSQDLDEMLGVALGPGGSGPNPACIQAAVTRADLCAWLRAFGEDGVAAKVQSLSDAAMQQIFQRGGILYLEKRPYMQALCLAAVEVVEGSSRALARKRSRNAT